jgi:ABC-2 type transport system ATP-binding protein
MTTPLHASDPDEPTLLRTSDPGKTIPLHTVNLGKRYGRQWALRDCSLTLPPGRVAALVGPNGAGKTTLLQLAVGLAAPSAGSIAVFGAAPRREPLRVLPRVGFVAQDQPLYRGFSVAEMLTVGRTLNARWDDALARTRLSRLGIPFDKKVGALSGGERAQVALALALAKRPALLLLDEPVAALDPLARREFLRALMEAAAEGLTVLLSSHIIADLERVCDYLIILAASRVQLAGDIDTLVAQHKLLAGPHAEADAVAREHTVIQAGQSGPQATLLVHSNGHTVPATWTAHDVLLEELVLAYLGQQKQDPVAAMARRGEGVQP